MTDIHTIKNLLYFLPYLRTETWYMLGIGIVIYAIYIVYLAAFERYYATQNSVRDTLPQKKSIRDALRSLRTEDIHFFEHLSFIIRGHLEDSGEVPLATKKTPKDIPSGGVSEELREVLDICTYYEYTTTEATQEKKSEILGRLTGII